MVKNVGRRIRSNLVAVFVVTLGELMQRIPGILLAITWPIAIAKHKLRGER